MNTISKFFTSRTNMFASVLILLGSIQTILTPLQYISPDIIGCVLWIIGIIVAVLRAITTTPVGGNVEPAVIEVMPK